MISYYDGNMTDIMPGSLKGDPAVQAMGYAISNMVKRVVEMSGKARVYAAIDGMGEDALDLLAVELRAKYYGDWLTLQEKRGIVKRTLLWYCKAGTPFAVQELADFVFQEAKIEEWFQYGGSEYLFRVIANIIDKDITLEKFLKFLEAVYEVKNTRSHLEAVIFIYKKSTEVRAVAAGGIGSEIKVKARVARRVKAEPDSKPVPVLFLNQNVLVKADNSVKEGDVYILSQDGGKVRVTTGNGCVVKVDGP